METLSNIKKLSKIVDKYRTGYCLCTGGMSKKMICVHLYAAAASGTRSVDIIKKMLGDCTDPQKLDQNLTIRRSVFLWQNIVLNSRRKSF